MFTLFSEWSRSNLIDFDVFVDILTHYTRDADSGNERKGNGELFIAVYYCVRMPGKSLLYVSVTN